MILVTVRMRGRVKMLLAAAAALVIAAMHPLLCRAAGGNTVVGAERTHAAVALGTAAAAAVRSVVVAFVPSPPAIPSFLSAVCFSLSYLLFLIHSSERSFLSPRSRCEEKKKKNGRVERR